MGARGGIQWRQVFTYQSHGALLVLLVAAIVTGIAHYMDHNNSRPLRLYDATVGLPLKKDTVPMAWACVGPFLGLLITAAAIEFGVMRRRQSLTMAVQAFCHLVFMAIVGFAVVLAITEATKPLAHRFRPDFLARCQPTGAKPGEVLQLGQPVECTGRKEQLGDGRKSFPSGHSSNTLSLTWYTLLYMSHALYHREGFAYMGGLWAKRGWGPRLLHELLQGIFIIWGCFLMCIAWFVGISRFVDNRHNIDDILGGFMVALLWMTPITIISLGQLTWYQRKLREENGEPQPGSEMQQLPVAVAPPGAAAAAGGGAGAAAAAGAAASNGANGAAEEGGMQWYDAKSRVGV